jgi:hypothetical protein
MSPSESGVVATPANPSVPRLWRERDSPARTHNGCDRVTCRFCVASLHRKRAIGTCHAWAEERKEQERRAQESKLKRLAIIAVALRNRSEEFRRIVSSSSSGYSAVSMDFGNLRR